MDNLFDERLLDYAESHSTDESDVLQELARETRAKVSKPQMLSGHLQGNFLKMLAAFSGAERILEVGTYTGYSAIAMASGMAAGGKLDTIDVNDELKSMVEHYVRKAGLQNVIQLWFDKAEKVIPKLQGPYDIVFIDADKQNYSLYYDLVFDKVRNGGIIVADNVLWSGKVLNENTDKDTEAIIAYNRKVKADNRVESVLLPVRDGLMISRKL